MDRYIHVATDDRFADGAVVYAIVDTQPAASGNAGLIVARVRSGEIALVRDALNA